MAIFPNVSEQKEDEIQVGPLTEVTKKICRLPRFILKRAIKSELYSTVYDFTITIQQVREGTKILFAGYFSRKVQKLIGAKESEKS